MLDTTDIRFLLIKFQLKHILSHRDPRARLQAIKTAPADLPDIYHGIMGRIERKYDKVFVLRILSWLFWARRPLRVAELLEALSVQENDINLEEEYFADPCDIIDCCQSLVVREESTDLVQFTHYTVQEFLLSNCLPLLLTPVDLAKTCLTYLNFEALEAGPCFPRSAVDERLMRYKFCQYAAIYWGNHAQGMGEEDPVVVEAVLRMLQSNAKNDSMLPNTILLRNCMVDKVY